MVVAILRALSRAVRRDLATFRSLQVNNFFLFVALLMYGTSESGMAPRSAYPFLLLLGLLLLFPLSSDPLAKIPPARLGLWPLGWHQRFGLRMASIALSPVMWVAVVLLAVTAPSLALGFVGLAVSVQAALAMVRRGGETRRPALPGPVLVRNNLRQMFCVLDVYLAVLLSAGGTVYRFATAHPDPDAFPILALLTALALSTYAQCLFGLDSQAAMTRYRAMPLSGRQILWAKDAAFLAIVFVLVLPLNVRVGLTFGLASLAIGQIASMGLRLPQVRWRFTGGRVMFGAVQMVLGGILAFVGWAGFAIAASGWLVSLYACGRK